MQKIIFLLLFALFSHYSFSQRARGADLTYSVNGMVVVFEAIVYFDYNSGSMYPGELNLDDGTGNNLDLLIQNSSIINNVLKKVYQGSKNYTNPGIYTVGICDMVHRSSGIANIPNSINFPLTLTANFELTDSSSYSSPLFANEHFNKTIINDTIYHNPGIYDPDGDSLSYELISCKGSDCDPIGLYAFPSQLGGFEELDSNGILSYSMPFQSMVSFAIKVTKWRNGVELCSAYRDILIENYFLGMDETDGVSEFSIFPNPASNNSIIRIESLEQKNSEIEIYQITGEKVLSQPILILGGSNEFELNISYLSKGVYFVRIENSIQIKKLIIQ